jgi:glycosyltransferase involved in cell wall biosynthesis
MPTVSVILPTYNRATLVMEAIASVLAQTYSDYEIIIVDDGSTDNTREVLRPLIDEGRINYVYQENAGLSAARNHGIRLAKGKYIAFLDSDDLFMPTKLEKQVVALDENPEVAFVHSGYSKFDNSGRDLGYRDTSVISGWVYPEILLQWSVLIAVPCVLVRASILGDVNGFDENMGWAEDLDLWRRISMCCPIMVIPEVLTKVRSHSGNISGDKTLAATAFRIYLNKAFAEDPDLGPVFRRRALAKMYANTGHNLLGEGEPEHMKLVREYSARAIGYWPILWSAYLGFAGSFLDKGARARLLKIWRKFKYRPSQS